MTVLAHIRNNATGEVRVRDTKMTADQDGGLVIFIWKDGNYSCDCNRSLFFARCADEDEPDVECSDGRFSVNLVDDGDVIYREIGETDD